MLGDWDAVSTREMDWTALKLLLDGIEPRRVRKRYTRPALNAPSTQDAPAGYYAFDMPSPPAHSPIAATDASALTLPQLVELVSKQEREIANLRRQVAWFQRQIFGQKSERRLPEPEGVQGTLGESFAAVPDTAPPNSKSRVAAFDRENKPRRPADGIEESTLFFDDKKVPVEVIAVPSTEMEGLAPDDYEVIGEKVSHRLAQRPGGHVILMYVRAVIKRRDTYGALVWLEI
nr:hypothetical protein [Noviherbaspirillum saxi]